MNAFKYTCMPDFCYIILSGTLLYFTQMYVKYVCTYTYHAGCLYRRNEHVCIYDYICLCFCTLFSGIYRISRVPLQMNFLCVFQLNKIRKKKKSKKKNFVFFFLQLFVKCSRHLAKVCWLLLFNICKSLSLRMSSSGGYTTEVGWALLCMNKNK